MFGWKEQYSCNIAEVDKQHKQLFRLAGDLHDLLQAPERFDKYDEIRRVLGELADYAVYHFSFEEKLMTEHGFDAAQFKYHQAEHTAFTHKIKHLAQQDFDKNQQQTIANALVFAVNWIDKHILDTDKRYVEFLNSKDVH
ncbi:bacteriohemerythrin [Acetonema longum]|uniref:Hemerythrin-like metal-binding domain-containing protein n=1 Tax=Acetonema longum DSM 6540 TaxID=1009370 RepID=F7NJA5_9FIRM|nr:bacteriohemerythrin [Acetonema longum]EGO63853.1 hemerythrin-like metal-binding domain-containing protein [Acetonema longum DSM 6540]